MQTDHAAPRYAVENLSRGSLLAHDVRVAGSSVERRKGLLGLDRLEEGVGIWIAPCEAIHTCGMRMPIDAVFLDANLAVCKISTQLPPWRFSFCWTAASVLELQAGTAARRGTKYGDRLLFRVISNTEEFCAVSR